MGLLSRVLVNISARQNSVDKNRRWIGRIDSEQNSVSANSNLALRASINKVVRHCNRVFGRRPECRIDSSFGFCVESF